MTLKKLLIETDFEIGPGGAKVISNGNIVPNSRLSQNAINLQRQLAAVLNKKNLMAKLKKMNLDTIDCVQKGNGDYIINFDGGGSVKILANELRGTTAASVKTAFKGLFSKKQCSDETEESSSEEGDEKESVEESVSYFEY